MTHTPNTHIPNTHIYVLLDRSGSMEAIRDDVIGGFNAFLAEQQADGDDARLTLVQFDTQDPAEVVAADVPIRAVRPLTAATFVPRGGTPLLDATGRLIARADARAAVTSLAHEPEHIVFLTITDGEENSSREFSRSTILRMVREREARGWTFAFLSAGLDAYAEAGGLGYDTRAVQSWAPTPEGAAVAFASVSAATRKRRKAYRANEAVEAGDFFGDDKPAEQHRS
jgi:hypothetical protein